MAKSVLEQVAAARENFKAEMAKFAEGLRKEQKELSEKLAKVEADLDEIEGKKSKKRKSGGGGTRGPSASAGKNEGKSVLEVVAEVIKANKGKATLADVTEAMEKAGDKRGANLSAFATQGHLKKVGEAEKAEGARGRAPAIYAIAKG